MSDSLIDDMALDLHIRQADGESFDHFSCRVAWSGIRFWMQAYCLDDGYGGIYGVSRSTIERKATRWLNNLADSYPAIREWFELKATKSQCTRNICSMLIAAGDLKSTPENLYRCTQSHTTPITEHYDAILGLTDPTHMTMPAYQISGMVYATPRHSDTNKTDAAQVWKTALAQSHWESRSWANSSNFKKAEFQSVDSQHLQITLPRTLQSLPEKQQLWIAMMTWPYESADDQTTRWLRSQYEPIVRELLAQCGVGCA